MINKPTPFKGLNIRIPIIIPIKGRGFINQGSTLRLILKALSDTMLSSLKFGGVPHMGVGKMKVVFGVPTITPSYFLGYPEETW